MATKQYQRSRAHKLRENGQCGRCMNPLPERYTAACCPNCLVYMRERLGKLYAERRANHECYDCKTALDQNHEGTRCQSCRDKVARINREGRARLRKEVIEAYGGRCNCCGEDHIPFLTIDHVNEDGASHRKTLQNTSTRLYQSLRANGFPNDPPLQVLCWNCNCAKHYLGICPHQES